MTTCGFDSESRFFFWNKDFQEEHFFQNMVDPMLERLTTLENNLTLLLSRAEIEPYASLDDALAAPSRFHQPISVRVSARSWTRQSL